MVQHLDSRCQRNQTAAQAKLIWATITPLRQAGNPGVIAEDTKRVQARIKIAVNGLFGLVEDRSEYWSADGVHFNGGGIAAEAARVVDRIAEVLQ